MGGKRRKSADQGGREECTGRIDKDVREINLQRNQKFLSNLTYCASKVSHILKRVIMHLDGFSKPYLLGQDGSNTWYKSVRSLMTLRA